jgi:1-pyrroline-4-hydroxy-2-carboxylate deaminase
VQLIKLAQAEVGMGAPFVRPPRLELAGSERDAALALIRDCLRRRPPAPDAVMR